MKLVAAMKVRDEGDVIEQNLRYHCARGVDEFIVTDNGSTDATADVLRRYRDAGLLRLIEQPEADFRRDAHGWVTRMARVAATEMGADWIVHVDADEFWWPIGGSLKEVLSEIPDRYGVVLAPRPEYPARPDGDGSWLDRLQVREARSRLRPKIAHRAHPDATLHRGAHDVDTKPAEDARQAGRAVMRSVKPDRFEDAADLVWAPIFPARVLHFPIRSFDQYKRRVETTIFHGGFEDKAHDELREQYEAGRLPELYDQLVTDDAALEAGLADGRLVRDEALKEVLAATPDPLAADSSAQGSSAEHGSVGHSAISTVDLDAERQAIELDAMASLARTQRSLIRQLDSHRERLERQRRKLRRLRRAQGGPLRRMASRARKESR